MTTTAPHPSRAVVGAPVRHRRPPVIVSSRYRCRVHLDVPVTARGTGCGPCRDDARQRHAQRDKPRPSFAQLAADLHATGDHS